MYYFESKLDKGWYLKSMSCEKLVLEDSLDEALFFRDRDIANLFLCVLHFIAPSKKFEVIYVD